MQTLYVRERKCGFPKDGGVYLLGGVYASREGATQRFVRISPPIPYPVKVHRTARIVNGEAVLNRQPIDTWWEGSSAKTEQKKHDMWAMDIFGMPIEKRINFGECEGIQDIDMCMPHMAHHLELDTLTILKSFRSLSAMEVGSMPKMAGYYDSLRTTLLAIAKDGLTFHTIEDVMYAQSIVWKMAYDMGQENRSVAVPYLSSLLSGFGFKKDAVAMRNTFLGDEHDTP